MGTHLQSIRCSHTVSIDVEEVLNKDLDPWLRQHGYTLAEHCCSYTVSIGVEEVLNKDLDPCLRQHGCTLAEHSLLPCSKHWCRGSLKQRFRPLATSAWVHTC